MRIYLILIGVCLGVVGSMDYTDAQIEQDLYCEMVSTGAWGDYNENYDEICPTELSVETGQEEGKMD